jgi:hypothetical protein
MSTYTSTDETLIGETPERMTGAERRAHRRMADAERHLIAVLTWGTDEPPTAAAVDAAEARCNRAYQVWRRACGAR